ncbi:MAG: class A beta-lactamase-related serine hydrolase [Chloroflexota bacterium]|nr:class A beta-lactamase-related serine hydrolase [Chloroflexota bacterium]
MSSVGDRIQAIADTFSGTLGVAAVSVATGEYVALNDRVRFPTASTIKLAILVEGFRQLETGERSRGERFTLEDRDKQAGTGVLRELDAGLELTFMDLMHLMTVVSDNTATNLLIDVLGVARINTTLHAHGLTDTELLRPITFELEDDQIPTIGLATPHDFALLLNQLANWTLLGQAADQEMLGILRRQQYRDYIPRYLPAWSAEHFLRGEPGGVWVADKPGILPGVRNDVAVIGRARPEYVLAVMTKDCADLRMHVDNEAALAIGHVSRAVYEHFLNRT